MLPAGPDSIFDQSQREVMVAIKALRVCEVAHAEATLTKELDLVAISQEDMAMDFFKRNWYFRNANGVLARI